jgi:hypothetical protein
MSDSDSDTEFPFDRIEPSVPVCLGVDPNFCKLAFNIKQTLYSDIMYQGQPDTEESQDTELNNRYETTIGIMYGLFMNLFKRKGQQNTGLPSELQTLPPNLKDKITELYNQCYQEANNADRKQLETYRQLIKNLFHTYVYDMGTER